MRLVQNPSFAWPHSTVVCLIFAIGGRRIGSQDCQFGSISRPTKKKSAAGIILRSRHESQICSVTSRTEKFLRTRLLVCRSRPLIVSIEDLRHLVSSRLRKRPSAACFPSL